MRRLLATQAPTATILIRIVVGGVFLTEGSTKIPVLFGNGFWGFSLTKLPRYGFLSMMHEARIDLAMWFGLLFLLVVGAGRKWSLDAKLAAVATNSDAAG